MRTLKFLVKDKRITRLDANVVVSGAVNHYELQFEFDDDWEGLTKTVILQNGDVLVELLYTGSVTIPWEVCTDGGILLSVVGTTVNADGKTQIVRTARMLRPIPVEPAGAEAGDEAQGFTPDVAAQILAVLGDVSALETERKSSIVAAVNEIYREAGIEGIRFKEEDAEGNRVYTVVLSRGAEYEIVAPIGKTGAQGVRGIQGIQGVPGVQGEAGKDGLDGKDGTTFTPEVSEDGVLHWTNDGEKENPPAVNIRGAQGIQGIQGEPGKDGKDGEKGEKGDGFRVLGYYADAAALEAAVEEPEAGDAYGIGSGEPYDIYIWDGVNQGWVNNGALQGAKGEPGKDGADGAPGKDGTNGKDGITPSIGENGNWYLGSTDTGQPSRGEKGETGAKGDTGATPGATGADGKTPVKGTDYFTEADKAEIAENAAGLVDLSGKQDKITASGILKGNGSGDVSAAVAGTDYPTVASVTAKQTKITATGILKGNGSGSVSAATAGSDYISPSNLTTRLNRSTSVNAADTGYTTYMARGIALASEETNPTVNGTIAFQYE